MTDSFSISVRVYYEDTDAGGIVYHGNYLKFMERARTEFLRASGQDHQALMKEQRLLVVTEAAIKFRRPAKLDDALSVTVEVESMGRARMTFVQKVLLNDELLCTGRFVVGCINSDTMKPAAITESLRNKLASVTNLTS